MKVVGQADQLRSQPMNRYEAFAHDVILADFPLVMREVPFPPYGIVDFYLPTYHLAIEVDGWGHEAFSQKRDEQRDARLLKYAGLPVARVTHEEIEALVEETVI